jgi:8-oxo-dGTP pyrophosphatase MutT (NUDIX family)
MNDKTKGKRGKPKFSGYIVSYGMIIYAKTNTDSIVFLLQQRRETFEYNGFIKGIYPSKEHLAALFTLMSATERKRIREYTFRELWDELWVDKSMRSYALLFDAAFHKYTSIRHLIPNILDTTQTYVAEPPWGFPKGKKNSESESDTECAIRETIEEARIKSKITVLPYVFSERYQGTNGKLYETHYHLGRVDQCDVPVKIITPNGITKSTVSDEVSNVQWLGYEDACSYLNPKRQLMLHEALKIIKS